MIAVPVTDHHGSVQFSLLRQLGQGTSRQGYQGHRSLGGGTSIKSTVSGAIAGVTLHTVTDYMQQPLR
jgi:hypothetical protein